MHRQAMNSKGHLWLDTCVSVVTFPKEGLKEGTTRQCHLGMKFDYLLEFVWVERKWEKSTWGRRSLDCC